MKFLQNHLNKLSKTFYDNVYIYGNQNRNSHNHAISSQILSFLVRYKISETNDMNSHQCYPDIINHRQIIIFSAFKRSDSGNISGGKQV